MLQRILCFLGFHRWEKDPARKDIVRGTGVHFAFWSEGYQKAERACTVPSCMAVQKVYRYGWCGMGGESSNWRRLRPKLEKQIDELPNIF